MKKTTKEGKHVSTSLVAFSNKKSTFNPVDLTSGDYNITGGTQRAFSTNPEADLINSGADRATGANGNG